MDKIYFTAIAKKLGFYVPYDNVDKPNIIYQHNSNLIYKKIRGGGSIGMHLDNNDTLEPLYFAQEFIPGKILTLGVLEKNEKYIPLGIVEIKLKGKNFYDQQSKYSEGFSSYAQYLGKNVAKINKISKRLFQFLSIKGGARLDLIENKNEIYLLEINTVPGLYEDSNFVFSASLKGLSFYQLLLWLINNAGFKKLNDS